MRFRFIQHDSPLATAIFTFQAGSLMDTKGREGIGHYLEHVLLDASSNYPDEVAVSDAFARIGARTNGGTGFGAVSYHGTCRASKLLDMVAIHCNLISAPLIRDEDVEREGQIVMSELKDGLDDAMTVLWHEILEGTLGWPPIIGYESTVPLVTSSQLRQHYELFHIDSNLMVTVCGPSSIEDEIRQNLVGLNSGSVPAVPVPAINLDDMALVEPRFGQACLAILTPGAPGNASLFRENLIAAVASNCIAGPDFSLLFRRLRGELGLTYWIGCNAVRWDAAGVACIMSQFDPQLMPDVKREIAATLEFVVKSGVPANTVEFAKDAMLTTAAASCETTGGRAYRFESYHLAGAKGIPDDYAGYETLMNSIKQADVDEYVQRVYGRMLDPSSSKTVTMMPA
ncbi:MAG: insulinase family protein [Deltaproteobacteria bacterium]|nr:insulinase family protein [Deltaproteobacteria bacterium]